jgi:hypothetical protein
LRLNDVLGSSTGEFAGCKHHGTSAISDSCTFKWYDSVMVSEGYAACRVMHDPEHICEAYSVSDAFEQMTQELAAEATGHHVEHPETSHDPSEEHEWHHYQLANLHHREGNMISHHIIMKKQGFKHTSLTKQHHVCADCGARCSRCHITPCSPIASNC